MAVDIGAKIQLTGEQQYREQMRQITQQTKLLKSETDLMKSTWDKDTSAKQKAAQQTELLNRQIKQQEQNVATAKANVDRFSASEGENSSKTLKWKNALAQAETELNRLRQELNDIPSSIEMMGQKMQSAGQKLKSIGGGMQKVGRGLSTYVTAPIVGLAAAAVKTTADFDTSMSKVQAVSGAIGPEFESLRAKAREMGSTTKFSASEAADAMNYMAMAGWKTGDMLDGVEGIMNLAAASGEDLATTSDIVTDALTAFGLSAGESGRLADIMAAASSNANTNVAMMGETFKYAAPVAGALGFTMEDTAVAIGLMANAGIKSSQAGTALRKGMSNLVKPTKAMKTAMEKYGIEVTNSDGSMKSLREIMEITRESLGGLEEAEQAEAAATIFGQNAMSGWLAVINATDDDFNKLTNSIDNSEGTAKSMAETMQDNLAGQLTILKSQLQELAISFGDILVPKIRKAVEWIQKQVDKFNSLDSATKEQILKFGMLAAAIGPVLLIGGKLVSSIGSILETGGKLLSWIGKTVPGFGGLVASIGPVAGAFGLAAGAGALLGFAIKDLNEKYGSTSAINDFNNYVRGTADAASEARTNLEESTKEIQATSENAAKVMEECELSAEMTDRYASELYELAGKTNRTAEEQRRMEAIISTLNGIYPGFTNAVMDSNGQLKMGVTELKNYVKQLENTAKVRALEGIIEDLTGKIVEATQRQIEAEKALEDAQNASTEAAEKKNSVVDELSRNAQKAEQASQNYSNAVKQEGFDIEAANAAELERIETLGRMNSGTVELGDETVKAAGAIEQLSDSENAATNEANALNDTIDENKKVVSETEEEVAGYQKQLNDLKEMLGLVESATEDGTEANEETAESAHIAGDAYEEYADDVGDAADEIEEANKKIRDAYDSAFESAKQSIMGQSSLWENAEQKEATSVDKMIAALASHEAALSNWNNNSTALLSSQRYQTDETFRSMVNSVIQGGEDLAPELQVIHDLWATGDERLNELVQHYGGVDKLSNVYSENIAWAKTAAEEGLEALKQAWTTGAEEAQEEPAKVFANPTKLVNGVLKGSFELAKQAYKSYRSSGSKMGEGVGQGTKDSNGAVQQGVDAIEETADSGVKAVENLEDDAHAAGQAVGDGISAGARAAKAGIDSAFTSLRTAVSMGITKIQNLKSTAKTAGNGLGTSLGSGITSSNGNVTSALNTIKASVNSGLTSISAKKSTARSAGVGIGQALASGVTSQSGAVYSAGSGLGGKLASGIGSTSGNATSQSTSLANAAKAPLQALGDSSDPWTWGRHVGDNFANGIGSAYGNVVYQANRIAQTVKDIIHFTHPDKGPLKEGTEIWGKHLAQDFAGGMRMATPAVEQAALGIASAASVIPTSTMLDIDALTGRNVAAEAVTSMDIMDAFIAAAEQIDWKVVIGNREFGRILREQGAIA